LAEFGAMIAFQQVNNYEKGTNRIGASRLQHIVSVQQVPISFFFEGAPGLYWTSLPPMSPNFSPGRRGSHSPKPICTPKR
jgi:transcriptional regulator with XRE-family HTH domain